MNFVFKLVNSVFFSYVKLGLFLTELNCFFLLIFLLLYLLCFRLARGKFPNDGFHGTRHEQFRFRDWPLHGRRIERHSLLALTSLTSPYSIMLSNVVNLIAPNPPPLPAGQVLIEWPASTRFLSGKKGSKRTVSPCWSLFLGLNFSFRGFITSETDYVSIVNRIASRSL